MLLWALVVAAVVTWLIVQSGILDRVAARSPSAGESSVVRRGPVYMVVSTMLTLPWTLYAD